MLWDDMLVGYLRTDEQVEGSLGSFWDGGEKLTAGNASVLHQPSVTTDHICSQPEMDTSPAGSALGLSKGG